MQMLTTNRPALCLVLLTCTLAACSSRSYRSLISENDVPSLVVLKDQATEHETTVHMAATSIENSAEFSLAVHETGRRDAARTVVMLHGAMSDNRTWRFVAGDLGSDHRLLLVDLPGSGLSDRPRMREMGQDGFTPDAMADRVLQALRLVMAADDESNDPITVVGHSLGGTILMRMFSCPSLRSRYADVLDRVDRMVLLAAADVDIESPPHMFEIMASVNGLEVTLGDWTGLLESQVADGARQSVCHPDAALREEADRICYMLTHAPTRRVHQEMLKQARPLLPDGRLDRDAVNDIVASYANIDIPCLVVWGARDSALPASMGYKLLHDIPGSELYVIEDCRHSAQIEHPAHCAAVIRQFSRRGTFDDGLATHGDHVLLAQRDS